MATSPKIVMQAMAKPISSSFALTAGPIAAMAEAPQMQVPTPISVDKALLNPRCLPSQRLTKKIMNMIMKTTTIPMPTLSHTRALVTIPREAITPLSKSREEKLMPGVKTVGRVKIFVSTILYMKAHIKLLIGLYRNEVRKAPIAIEAQNRIPGYKLI
jgi:hypothetical protein